MNQVLRHVLQVHPLLLLGGLKARILYHIALGVLRIDDAGILVGQLGKVQPEKVVPVWPRPDTRPAPCPRKLPARRPPPEAFSTRGPFSFLPFCPPARRCRRAGRRRRFPACAGRCAPFPALRARARVSARLRALACAARACPAAAAPGAENGTVACAVPQGVKALEPGPAVPARRCPAARSAASSRGTAPCPPGPLCGRAQRRPSGTGGSGRLARAPLCGRAAAAVQGRKALRRALPGLCPAALKRGLLQGHGAPRRTCGMAGCPPAGQALLRVRAHGAPRPPRPPGPVNTALSSCRGRLRNAASSSGTARGAVLGRCARGAAPGGGRWMSLSGSCAMQPVPSFPARPVCAAASLPVETRPAAPFLQRAARAVRLYQHGAVQLRLQRALHRVDILPAQRGLLGPLLLCQALRATFARQLIDARYLFVRHAVSSWRPPGRCFLSSHCAQKGRAAQPE